MRQPTTMYLERYGLLAVSLGKALKDMSAQLSRVSVYPTIARRARKNSIFTTYSISAIMSLQNK
jgi:hypothetical protein